MAWCLIPKLAEEFKRKLVDGTIDIYKLSKMTSEQRRSFFSEFLGKDNAKQVNSLFESKLLLKNQQKGMITWAQQVAGLKPEVRRDLISRIEKMEEILNPKNEEAFLADLIDKKLGTTVTVEEAKIISDLSKKKVEAYNKIDRDSPAMSDSRMEYGRALVELDNYINDLKIKADKLSVKEYATKPLKAVSNLGGLAKSLKASLDNSVIGRQGLKTLFTNPKIWLKNSKQSFKDIFEVFGGKNVMDEIRADVLSRENALNGTYKKEKLAVNVTEEAYPTSLPERVPGVGRAFKASETAFTGFQYRTRADLFDKYAEIAKKSEGDITGLGKLVNSMTARGSLGPVEPIAGVINNVFFSPRLLKSNIDTLTAHLFSKEMNGFARKQAAINLIKIAGGIGSILAIAKAVKPDSVEADPRSADFGKIKIGDSRFDVSGGMSGLATLGSRIATQSSKSSTTGQVRDLNTGEYGSQSTLDIIYNFFENKTSPLASVIKDLLKGEDFEGNKPTFLNESKNLLTPLPITNYQELKDEPNSANILLAMIADALGIGVNTYPSKKDSLKREIKQGLLDGTISEKEAVKKIKTFQSQQDQYEAEQAYQRMVDRTNEEKQAIYNSLPDSVKIKLDNIIQKNQ